MGSFDESFQVHIPEATTIPEINIGQAARKSTLMAFLPSETARPPGSTRRTLQDHTLHTSRTIVSSFAAFFQGTPRDPHSARGCLSWLRASA
jgi:hypothetical protein